jgi:hypothetical protein
VKEINENRFSKIISNNCKSYKKRESEEGSEQAYDE